MKVLIVGLGAIAQKHIDALQKLEKKSVEIYALRRERSAIQKANVINVFAVDDVQGLSFAIISNPTSEHAKAIEMLLSLQIPLFIEKPLFNTLGYSGLVTKVQQKGVTTYIACNLRFLECLQYIKTAVLPKHRINEVNVYCGSYLPEWRPGVDFRKVYSANKELGGGVHIDLIHEMDYVYWFFNKPIKVHKHFSNASSLEITSFDYANYLWVYEEFSVNIQLNYFRRDAKRTIELVCDEGTCLVDLLSNRVYWNGNSIFESKNRIIDTYGSQIKFFIDEVMPKKSTFNDIVEAYEILKLCLED